MFKNIRNNSWKKNANIMSLFKNLVILIVILGIIIYMRLL